MRRLPRALTLESQDSNAMPNKKRFLLPLGVFLLPLVLAPPYFWLVFRSPLSGSIVTTELDEEQRSIQLSVWFVMSWLVFSIVCALAASMILAFMHRSNTFASVYLVVTGTLVVAALIFVSYALFFAN
jgi:hypothetical protein